MGLDNQGAALCFGGFTLDLTRGLLLAADGSEVPLRPKSFALLRHLAENAGRLVDRDTLMQAVWPGVIVTEDSITQCVKEVRRALGDDEQRLLRTLPRRGYLFAAEPPRGPAPAGSDVAPPPPNRPMVVVLPLENIGGDPEQGYFADGLTTDLATDLARFQTLRVVTPGRRGFRPDEQQGTLVGTVYLVGGSVRRAGGRIRVTAQLQEATGGVHLWAERFDRPLDDLFAVQEELAEHLAARLVSQVDQEGLRTARRRPPQSLTAYDLCLRGRELFHRTTEADTLLAREMFDRAMEADPEYAPAYAWQAFVVQRGMTHLWGEPRGREAVAPALTLAQRAVEIEPDSPLCVTRLAFVLLLCGRYDEAVETARRALRLNPNSFWGRLGYGEALGHAGEDLDAGVREVRLAIGLDPFHPPGARFVLGKVLLLAGRLGEALAELRWCAERLPDYGPCWQHLVVAAVETGHMDEARASVREVLRLSPHLTTLTIGQLWFYRHSDVVERFRAAFRAAGLPEG